MKIVNVSIIAAGLLLGTPAVHAQVSGKIEAIEDGGREITLAGRRLRIGGESSDDATEITVDGKPAKRRDLKPGMQCKADAPAEAMDRRSRRSAARASKLACD